MKEADGKKGILYLSIEKMPKRSTKTLKKEDGTDFSINITSICYEQALLQTYYKFQGMTCEKIVIDLNPSKSTGLKKLDLRSLNVGCSRPRFFKDLRLMPMGVDPNLPYINRKKLIIQQLNYLRHLGFNKNYLKFRNDCLIVIPGTDELIYEFHYCQSKLYSFSYYYFFISFFI